MTASAAPRVRRIRADEWRSVRALRIEAVNDPVAEIAFLDTPESTAARTDEFWRERTLRAAESDDGAQFVAEIDDDWVGSLTVLMRRSGTVDHLDRTVPDDHADIVGVFVRASHRGTGVVDALLAAAIAWAHDQGTARVFLDVHLANTRAQRAYRRNGFRETGEATAAPSGIELQMIWAGDGSAAAVARVDG